MPLGTTQLLIKCLLMVLSFFLVCILLCIISNGKRFFLSFPGEWSGHGVKLSFSSPPTAKAKNAWSYAFSPLHVFYLLVSHIQNIKWKSIVIKKTVLKSLTDLQVPSPFDPEKWILACCLSLYMYICVLLIFIVGRTNNCYCAQKS
jgi:hypothetical protein